VYHVIHLATFVLAFSKQVLLVEKEYSSVPPLV
jgi:hypothetical protein